VNQFCLIFTLSTPWENYHREQFIKSIAKKVKEYNGYLLCIEPTVPSIFNLFKYSERIIKWIRGKYNFRKVDDNIYAVPAKTIEHILLSVRFKPLSILNRFLLRKQVFKLISMIHPDTKDLILVLHRPELHYLIGAFRETGVIYDCCDDFIFTSNMNRLKVLGNQKRERLFSRKCNFILTTSEKLYNRINSYNLNTYLIENGYGYKISNEENASINSYMVNIPKPLIGYIGNIRSWIDFDLLEYIIEKFPNYSFVFVGSVDKDSEKILKRLFEKYHNISLTGRVQYDDIPQYLRYFDVGIIPFKTNKFMESANPNKFYEYIGSGVPVVTTNIGDIKNKYSHIARVANSKYEFADQIESIINLSTAETRELKHNILEIAKIHTWEYKSNSFYDLVKKHILYKQI
jgi:glycosyltransferase involved in cell wall biosynthesis